MSLSFLSSPAWKQLKAAKHTEMVKVLRGAEGEEWLLPDGFSKCAMSLKFRFCSCQVFLPPFCAMCLHLAFICPILFCVWRKEENN